MSEERLGRIEQKIDTLTDGVVTLAITVRRIEDRFGQLDQKIDVNVGRLDSRIGGVDRKIDDVAAQLGSKIDSGIGRLDQKLDSIIDTQSHINRELSDRHADHESRISALETERPAGR